MPRTVLMDEFHVTISAPAGLRKAAFQTILRRLRSKQLKANLHAACYPSLQRTRYKIHQNGIPSGVGRQSPFENGPTLFPHCLLYS